ncbi:hypothetical protein [Cellulomonas olei]|uniref:hypothetical protein n=1 Tax=Cellulomonas sp. P4 TaxID=3142533 RepID=UPI0031B9D32D
MIYDEPTPIECGKCQPSTTTGARAKFTDTPSGRRAHLRVFGHSPEHPTEPDPRGNA